MSYEQFKHLLLPTSFGTFDKKRSNSIDTSVRNFVCGAMAGVSASFVTYPFDIIRTRLAYEINQTSISVVATDIYSRNGVGGFFKGIGPTLIGMVINIDRFRMLASPF